MLSSPKERIAGRMASGTNLTTPPGSPEFAI
jgi:hypothetical protein